MGHMFWAGLWSRSQRNLGSGSTDIVCGASEFYKQCNVFSDFLDQTVLEPEPKILDAWSWSLKFESRVHGLGSGVRW